MVVQHRINTVIYRNLCKSVDNKTIRIIQERKRMSTFCFSFQCQAICSILKCNLVLVTRAISNMIVNFDDDETLCTYIQNNFVPEATQYILVYICMRLTGMVESHRSHLLFRNIVFSQRDRYHFGQPRLIHIRKS